MKKLLIIAVSAIALSGCLAHNNQGAGTVAGGLVGGVVGISLEVGVVKHSQPHLERLLEPCRVLVLDNIWISLITQVQAPWSTEMLVLVVISEMMASVVLVNEASQTVNEKLRDEQSNVLISVLVMEDVNNLSHEKFNLGA